MRASRAPSAPRSGASPPTTGSSSRAASRSATAPATHLLSGAVGIDMPAGPSEVLVLASADAPAELVAADLLAQAEHDPDAVPLVFTDSARLAARVTEALARQLAALPAPDVAR